MEAMIVPEPQVLETNSEVEVEQSNDVQSSESLVPNVSSDVVSTDDVSTATMDGPSENLPNDGTEDSSGANLDQVSSSTEPFSGSCRDVLPSVNHQMGVIPNMEPYLEDGSLDGTSKEVQDPTSTNGNLALEETSNPDLTSNHVDSGESPSGAQDLQENADRQLESNLNSENGLEEGVNSAGSIETPLNNGTSPEEEQVASCSNQLIEESTSAICDNAAATVVENEEYRTITEPFTSEDPVPENESANLEMETAERVVVGEAEPAGQLESLESSDAHFAAEAYPESVSSLTQAEMAQPEEPVSNSLADCTIADEASNEIVHEENVSSEPASQLVEASDEGAVAMESDYVDSSTLQMEDQEFVATEPDASLMEQEDSHGMPIADQGTSESFPSADPGQLENASESVAEVNTVDSSVDHVIQHVDDTPDAIAGGSFHEESIEADQVDSRETVDDDAGMMDHSETIEAGQVDSGVLEGDLVEGGNGMIHDDQVVDSGAVESDVVDGGSAETGLIDETMETGHADSRNVENESEAIDGESMEPAEGIILDNPTGNEDQVVYDEPIGSGTVEDESIEAQPVEAQPMEAHLMEAQPDVVEAPPAVDEGVDSSYYIDQATMEQPDGAIAEESEAATDIENPLPTPSHLDPNFQCSEVANSELETMETAMSNPTAVCEADSSAAGMEDSSYEAQQMVDTQNVYVVEDGRLTVQQSNSMASYHNADNTMLVEMAPLSTDGSYVNSQVTIRYFM